MRACRRAVEEAAESVEREREVARKEGYAEAQAASKQAMLRRMRDAHRLRNEAKASSLREARALQMLSEERAASAEVRARLRETEARAAAAAAEAEEAMLQAAEMIEDENNNSSNNSNNNSNSNSKRKRKRKSNE